jgi:regulatory protein
MHSISEIKDFSKAKSKIVFDDETFLVVYKGMYKGDPGVMQDDEFEALVSDMISYGKKRAMNLLIKKDYSVKALCKKLEEDGYGPMITEKILEFLNSFHYLDDLRLAENLIRDKKASKSKAEIRFLLKKREIPDDVAERAIEEVYLNDAEDNEEKDPEVIAIINQLKKMGMTPEKIGLMEYKDKQKLAAGFYRKGFKSENITKTLRLETFE